MKFIEQIKQALEDIKYPSDLHPWERSSALSNIEANAIPWLSQLLQRDALMVEALERIRQNGEVGAPGQTIKTIAEHYLRELGELDD